MTNRIEVDDRVEIEAGDEKGGWGIVRLIDRDHYHVGMYGDNSSDIRVFQRNELRKPRKK